MENWLFKVCIGSSVISSPSTCLFKPEGIQWSRSVVSTTWLTKSAWLSARDQAARCITDLLPESVGLLHRSLVWRDVRIIAKRADVGPRNIFQGMTHEPGNGVFRKGLAQDLLSWCNFDDHPLQLIEAPKHTTPKSTKHPLNYTYQIRLQSISWHHILLTSDGYPGHKSCQCSWELPGRQPRSHGWCRGGSSFLDFYLCIYIYIEMKIKTNQRAPDWART